MITIKNVTNGEVIKVWQTGIDKATGKIYSNGTPTAKYLAKYPLSVTGEKLGEDSVVILEDGWEIVRGRQPKPTTDTANTENKPAKQAKPRNKKKPTATAATDAATADANNDANGDTVTDTNDTATNVENVVEGYVTDAEAGMTLEEIKAELLTKYGALGGDVFDAVCKAINYTPATLDEQEVTRICSNLIKKANARPANTIEVNVNGETHVVKGKTTANFKAIVTTVKCGFPVYMHGEAGTGKSHTAKQVAEALGLPFYEAQQVLFAHEMKGYGDAGGNFVPTPFFKAFTEGGLFFLDEIDASQPEALVVLNTAIANGRFDFPVVGNVTAHPNFRVIAAGNTKLTGADIEYTARQVQDASTKNRFFFVGVDYCKEIEDELAGRDKSIADFCRDLRRAKNECQINLCVSYRQIQTLANKDMQAAWSIEDLLTGGVFKELETDEIRLLYQRLENKSSKWARGMRSLCQIPEETDANDTTAQAV